VFTLWETVLRKFEESTLFIHRDPLLGRMRSRRSKAGPGLIFAVQESHVGQERYVLGITVK